MCVTDVPSAAPLVACASRSIPLLMKLLTGNKFKWRSLLWKCIIDWAVKEVSTEVRGPFTRAGPDVSGKRPTRLSLCYITQQTLQACNQVTTV